MLISNIIIVLSIILPLCVAIFLFRNFFLQNYSGSPKRYKGYALILMYIGSLLCSLFSGYTGFHIYDAQKQVLERKDLQLAEIKAMQSFIFSETKTALVFIIIGLILFSLTFFLKRNIEKDIAQIAKANVSWDLTKLGKSYLKNGK